MHTPWVRNSLQSRIGPVYHQHLFLEILVSGFAVVLALTLSPIEIDSQG